MLLWWRYALSFSKTWIDIFEAYFLDRYIPILTNTQIVLAGAVAGVLWLGVAITYDAAE